ncbi:phosphoglycolate phosphatase [Pseudorhizobium endolithicum]|uniref:Phosphoglycolate phosphatase n=1 Tax=Pseudorhizobium endolithicum TaxID=1191678 RepID=A0ABM8PS02_9HYPH|nr:phosphoglycolate phosphatase [Pseudorhizobium endolithicum]CAD7045256.1 phosphoglycolate phosphatase [Pseudorhizobium endolithicum]
MTAPLVIFDLDGTLVDTAPDLIASLNHTIAAAGLAPVTYADLTHLVGQGTRVMIRRAFELRGRHIGDDAIEPLLDRFLEHYKREMPGSSRPYPGLTEALDRLSEAGANLAVCTNKLEELAVPLMEKLGLLDRFITVTGGDTFPVRKPDARHILGTIERAGRRADQAVMIGDSINDILAARNAGIPSIAVTFGYSDVPVAELQPDHVIDHFSELTTSLVDRLIGAGQAATAAQA